MRYDAKVWLNFLINHSGKVMFLPAAWLSSDLINLKSDASPQVGAFIYGSRWFRIEYPPEWAELNIAFLEFFPIVAGLDTFKHLLANHRINFITDNQAVAHIINKQTSKHPDILQLVRVFVSICLAENIHVSSQYIPSKLNVEADFLSRFQPSDARLRDFGLLQTPSAIPVRWLPKDYALQGMV